MYDDGEMQVMPVIFNCNVEMKTVGQYDVMIYFWKNPLIKVIKSESCQ